MTSYDIPQLESMFTHNNVFFLVTIITFYSFPCIFFSMGGAIAVHVGVQGLLGPSLSGLAVIDVVEGKKNTLNPLTPKSDQHQISPCNINAL